MFEQRRIEAMILKHVYDTLKVSHGMEMAQQAIADAVRAASIEQASEFAAKVGGNTSIQTFVDRQSLWKVGGAMELDVLEQTEAWWRDWLGHWHDHLVRWEYRPGSALYFVWQQERSDFLPFEGDFRTGRDTREIFGRPSNVFLVKATYWFAR